ncbi:hypothetical protein WN944_010942 [Citrus x changshan-huyou]|uniref:Uncharacterized protein n=1 Tax=Citrus x changshan-huyou TaxID=2935761 RepID=A0AAP0QYB3_9ROSI
MANPEKKESSDLFEKVFHKNTTHRVFDVTVLILLLCLLLCRLLSFKYHGFAFAWFLAFLCESCFTFIWILIVNCKWTLLTYKTYPQRLQERNEILKKQQQQYRAVLNIGNPKRTLRETAACAAVSTDPFQARTPSSFFAFDRTDPFQARTPSSFLTRELYMSTMQFKESCLVFVGLECLDMDMEPKQLQDVFRLLPKAVHVTLNHRTLMLPGLALGLGLEQGP